MKILLVDDDEDIVTMLDFRLKKLGFETTITGDGKGALESVKASKPDLIIMDLNIPEPNGIEVSRILKADSNFSSIPIILLTGSAELEGKEVPADALIIKPYEWSDLQAIIEKLTGSPKPS